MPIYPIVISFDNTGTANQYRIIKQNNMLHTMLQGQKAFDTIVIGNNEYENIGEAIATIFSNLNIEMHQGLDPHHLIESGCSIFLYENVDGEYKLTQSE